MRLKSVREGTCLGICDLGVLYAIVALPLDFMAIDKC